MTKKVAELLIKKTRSWSALYNRGIFYDKKFTNNLTFVTLKEFVYLKSRA